jgi:hypothetical protein
MRYGQVTKGIYASGAWTYQMLPSGVDKPRTREAVLKFIRNTAAKKRAIFAGSACTSLTGRSIKEAD